MNSLIKFGTDGWRSIIADEFTFQNVRIVANAIGKYILTKYGNTLPVLIGFDTRFLADKFASACADKLAESGLKVKISDSYVPTPVIAYTACSTSTAGAIQFTASHNPPEYCGIKYITSYGGPAPEEVTDEIVKNINLNIPVDIPKKSSIQKEIETFNPKENYIKHLKTIIDFNRIKESKVKVIYDPMFGAGNKYLDHILGLAGCEISTIHNKRDPMFGNLLPEPREQFLSDLKNNILKEHALLGLATDGDADRLAAIDNKGKFYTPNQIACMLLRHLVKNKKLKGKVVRTLSTTHMLDRLAQKYGLELIETKVGFKWICKEMLKSNVLIGAEESGGISILNHVPDKDAILAGVLLVEMIAYENKSLEEIYSDTIKDAGFSYINDKFDLHMDDAQKKLILSLLNKPSIKNIGGIKLASINTSEGVKYVLEDGSWFFARSSGTEPMFRVYFESQTEQNLQIMKKYMQNIIDETC